MESATKVFSAVKYLNDKLKEQGLDFVDSDNKTEPQINYDNAIIVLAYFCYNSERRENSSKYLSPLEKALTQSVYFYLDETYDSKIGDTFYFPIITYAVKNGKPHTLKASRLNDYGGELNVKPQEHLDLIEKDILDLVANDFKSYCDKILASNPKIKEIDERFYDLVHKSAIDALTDKTPTLVPGARKILLYVRKIDEVPKTAISFISADTEQKINNLNTNYGIFKEIISLDDLKGIDVKF